MYESDTRETTLALLGDTIPTRRFSVHREDAFLKLRDLLHSADAVFSNLDASVHVTVTWQDLVRPSGRRTPLQHGGPTRAGSPYWVGERGPELMVPRTAGYVLSHANAMRLVTGQQGSQSVVRHEGTVVPAERYDRMAQERALRRDMLAEDLIGPLVFLCSEESSMVTGHCLVVDGGQIFQ